MAKPNATAPNPNRRAAVDWGTWEDLLLAFAVNRHGTSDWDSVSSELRKRTALPLITSQKCHAKYSDLKRRFATPNDDCDGKSNASLLQELRRLRVAELRREVHRYDLNIESLEMKVKEMKEERDRRLRKEESESDLEKESEGKTRVEPLSEPAMADEPVTGEELEKDQISVNESNSTDPEAERSRTGMKEPEPARAVGGDVRQDRSGQVSEEPADLKAEPDLKPVREDSCNGSSNSIDRTAKNKPKNVSTDLVEPEAESRGGREAGGKENSDVQSSASRSRKKEGNDKLHRASTSRDEREHEDKSQPVEDSSAELQPLVDFLQSIRSQKFGSIFHRRLRSQDSSRYRKLVLQHMDLVTIETRVKEGWYAGSSSKFFRDILLLANNAVVFFGKKSAEANAATEIRRLVSKERSQKHSKSNSSSSRKHISLSTTNKQESEPLLKPRISSSLIFCRKHSSIAAAEVIDKKKEQVVSEKDSSQHKCGSAGDAKNKRRGDRFPLAKKNVKNQPSSSVNKNVESSCSGKQQGLAEEAKKMQPTKKQGTANLLNRMKNNGGVVDSALKNRPRPLSNESTRVDDGARKKNAEEIRQVKDEKSRLGKRRNAGRPPKQVTAARPPPPAPGKRIREKEKGETETERETPRPKQGNKRSRKI